MANLDPAHYPDPFFIFVDQANWLTAHNLNVSGALFSTPSTGSAHDFRPFIPNPDFTGDISPFLARVMSAYRLEYDAEQVRRTHAPEAPSRLGAVFAFGSYADCEHVANKHGLGWDLAQVEQFRPAPGLPIAVRKVNMEIVSLMNGHYTLGSWDQQPLVTIWSAYWRGETSITVDVPAPPPQGRRQETSGCIWEYLVDGRVLRV